MARPRTQPEEPAKQESYKALTYLHLPVIEKPFAPGETVTLEDLEAAGQTDENIAQLVEGGALGGPDDPIHTSHILPSPGMPTIASVVAQSRALVSELEAAGEEVPDELRAVAELDYTPIGTDDAASGGDTNA